jgi:hypothetical protein
MVGARAANEVAQAAVVLLAGRAPVEMRAHAGHGHVGVAAAHLGVDVLVEPVEALVASELGLPGAEQAGGQGVSLVETPLGELVPAAAPGAGAAPDRAPAA